MLASSYMEETNRNDECSCDFLSDLQNNHILVQRPNNDFEDTRRAIREELLNHRSIRNDVKLFFSLFVIAVVFSPLAISIALDFSLVAMMESIYPMIATFSLGFLLAPIIALLSNFRARRNIKNLVSEYKQRNSDYETLDLDGVDQRYLQIIMTSNSRSKIKNIFNDHGISFYKDFLVDPLLSLQDSEGQNRIEQIARIKTFAIILKEKD